MARRQAAILSTSESATSTAAQNRMAYEVSSSALQSCTFTRVLYSNICPSSENAHNPMLTAANGSALFRLTSAMTGSASYAAPQKMLRSEKNVDKAVVKAIKSPPVLIASVSSCLNSLG